MARWPIILLPVLLFGQSHVVSVAPSQNAIGIEPGANLSAVFDIGLNPATVNDTTFNAFGGLSGRHAGSVSYNIGTRTAILDPDRDFVAGEIVTVVLTRAMTDSLGSGLAGYAWNFTIAAAAGAAILMAPSSYPCGTGPAGIYSAFLNADSILDLAATNIASQNISVLLGNGDGTFQPPANYPTGVEPAAVACADLDRDGDMDAVVACAADNAIRIYFNDGSGGLTPDSQYAAGAAPSALALSDYNRDGRPDIATVNRSGNDISVFLGIGDGTFQPAVSYVAGNGPVALSGGDVDQDGDLDLLLALRNTNKLKVMLNNGDGTFTAGQQYPADSRPNDIYAAPFNSLDRFLDAATANNNANNVSVLTGNGDGTFGNAANFPILPQPRNLVAADMDADADLDIVASHTGADSVALLINDGSAGFPVRNIFPAGDSLGDLCAADFNRDGALDIALTSATGNCVIVLLNFADTLPPGPPQNLTANGANPSPWTADSIFVINWINPSDPSGIKRSLFKLSSPPTANYDTTGTMRGAAPDTVTASVPAGQNLYLWLEDNAGNLDYQNYAAVSLRYDTIPPSGSVASAPIHSNTPSFNVNWTPGSDTGGSGLTGRYDVRLKDGADPWSVWLTDYPGLSAVFNGLDGHRYCFEAAGRDSAGNIEVLAGVPECSTSVDTIRPFVASTIPAPLDTGVSTNTDITVTFSERMDSATIVNANFSMIGSQSGNHAFVISYDPADYPAVLDPTVNFAVRETVTVTVYQAVSDRAGNQMAANRVWTFRIGTLIDTLGPATSSGNVQPNPCEPTANLAVSAFVSDAGRGDNVINAAEFFLDAIGGSGTGIALAPADTYWNEISEDVITLFDNQSQNWIVGDTHDIFIHGRDAPGNWGDFDTVSVAVIPDDDTLGPSFSGFSPLQWPDTTGFLIECQITDPSGVYDDTTGSAGQGVYLLWDNDGEILIDAREITMSNVFGSYYRSDSLIPVQAHGAALVYEINAFDNDFDTQHPGDRKKGRSGLQAVAITDVRGPAATNTAAVPNPTHGAIAMALNAQISDSLRGNSAIRTAEYFVDAPGLDSTGYPLLALDGVYDEIREAVTDTLDISAWPYGTFRWLFVHGLDSSGNWGGFDSVRVAVTPPEDTILPFIVLTTPDSAETGVALNRNISITFSEPMDPLSLDTSKFHVLGSIHPVYRCGLSYEPLTFTVVLDPDSLFSPAETIQVNVSNAVTDTAGNGMLDPYAFFFVTGIQSDTAGPRVTVRDVYPDTTLGVKYCQITATISDSATGRSVIRAAEIFIDSTGPVGTGYPMLPADSIWDEIVEPAYRRHNIQNLNLGLHRIYLRGKDDAGNWGRMDSLPLLVTPDDDTLGPAFTSFRPDSVPDTSGFYVYCAITDPSGVYDDSTGSTGQGVYMIWNATGLRPAEDMEMKMSRTAGDTFRTDFKIPQQANSVNFTCEVFAYDNDFDFGETGDRTKGSGGLRTIMVYDARGPVTSYIQVSPPNPPAGITRIVLYAAVTDSQTGLSQIGAAEAFLDSTGLPGAGYAMHPTDGVFDEVKENIFDTIPVSGWQAAQTHKFYVRGRDGHANWGHFDSISVYVSPYVDTIPPAVAFTLPARADTGVVINTWIYVNFTERVDPATVTSDKLLIEGDVGGVYDFWMSYNSQDSMLSINPLDNFALNESVTVYISSGIRDLVGNTMVSGYSWWFKTGTVEDTIGPVLTLQVSPNPADIGDSVLITVTAIDDTLFPDSAVVCTVWTADSVPHRLRLVDPVLGGYEGKLSTAGFPIGDCQVVVYGWDRALNVDSAHTSFNLSPAGEFLPPATVYAWPNPVRSGQVHFHYYVNQNARVKVEVFNLTGRRVAEISGLGVGGLPPHQTTSNALVWDVTAIASDVYLFRLTAESEISGEKGTVMKKFAVVK
jgi:hypothetical protein